MKELVAVLLVLASCMTSINHVVAASKMATASATTSMPSAAKEESTVQPRDTPHHLDLAVSYNGEQGYFSSVEWNKLSYAEKSKYTKIGMVISTKGQQFIVELKDRGVMGWEAAMSKYKRLMPTKEQGMALASIGWNIWVSKMNAYGGETTKMIWTRIEYNPHFAWSIVMLNGSDNNAAKTNTYSVRAILPLN